MRNKFYITLGIFLAYALSGQLGFLVTRWSEWNAAFFWPPSGVALAAILLFGRQALPAIFLGALCAGLLLGLQPTPTLFPKTLTPYLATLLIDVSLYSLLIGLIISTASTLGPLTAAMLLKRIDPDAPLWSSASDLLKGTAAMALASAIAGIGGIGALTLADLVPRERFVADAGMWWMTEFFGMLIFTPAICLAARYLRHSPNYESESGSLVRPVIFYSGFAALALGTFLFLWNLETDRISNYLTREADTAANTLATILKEAGQDMEEIRALFYASDAVKADDFRRFAMTNNMIRLSIPGVQAVGWAPHVTNAKAWVNQLRKEGYPQVKLYERDRSGKKVLAAPRSEYFPLHFIQPEASNASAIGFDLASEESRRQALHRARDTGQLSMTSKLSLIQLEKAEPAILICAPIYRPDLKLNSIADRRAHLTGFASAVYLIEPMLDSIQMDFGADLDLHLFEESQAVGQRWYHTKKSKLRSDLQTITPAPMLASLQKGLNGNSNLTFAGHSWQVLVTPGPTFTQSQRTWIPFGAMTILLALGMVSSGILIERITAQRSVRLERRKTEQALIAAQKANNSKAYFMAAASHDIKQPLYALTMLTDTLLMTDTTGSVNPVLVRLRNSIEQMSKHFDDLMDMAKFRDGQFDLSISTLRLRDFSNRIDLEIAPLCASKGLAWNLVMDDVAVNSDPELLLRLFRNLLINAVDYTDSGEVLCSAKADEKFVEFLISDTGCGIAKEHQKTVFERFTRIDIHQTHTTGTGLGLSIVAKIAQALDLDLQMTSAIDEGTTFRFRIPLTPNVE